MIFSSVCPISDYCMWFPGASNWTDGSDSSYYHFQLVFPGYNTESVYTLLTHHPRLFPLSHIPPSSTKHKPYPKPSRKMVFYQVTSPAPMRPSVKKGKPTTDWKTDKLQIEFRDQNQLFVINYPFKELTNKLVRWLINMSFYRSTCHLSHANETRGQCNRILD